MSYVLMLEKKGCKNLITNIDFDGYYVVRTGEDQPRLKYIFKKCG